MKRSTLLAMLTLLIITVDIGPPVYAADDNNNASDVGGLIWGVLCYVPNRVMDVTDLVRARVRVGPGFAAGVRVTEVADLQFGAYTSLFAGLPGPRQHPGFKLPIGMENYAGLEVSVADASIEELTGPSYSMTECGVSGHFLLFGLDFTVDPWELVDLAAGVLTIDLRGDDL